MPPAVRPARQRLAARENDENVAVTHLKGKGVTENSRTTLQAKKVATTTTTTRGAANRKRAALGDVSNVAKPDAVEGKKTMVRPGSVSKAAQPVGVTKTTRTSTRSTAAVKESNRKTEVSRTGSGAGLLAPKKRASASPPPSNAPSPAENNQEDLDTEDKAPAESTLQKDGKVSATTDVVDENDAQSKAEARKAARAQMHPGDLEARRLLRHVDYEEMYDPHLVPEYSHDIVNYLRQLEKQTMVNPDYMDFQDDLEWSDRNHIADSIINIAQKHCFAPETTFLAVNVMDRFLSTKVTHGNRLELVAVTSLMIAAKYEEVLCPHISTFAVMLIGPEFSDQSLTQEERDQMLQDHTTRLIQAEKYMLAQLNFDMSYPSPMTHLRRISKADGYDVFSRNIGKFLVEISMVDHRFLPYPPSLVAAAAMHLARMILNRGEWDEDLEYYSGYKDIDIEPVVILMVDYMVRPQIHRLVSVSSKSRENRRYTQPILIAMSWARKNHRYFDIPYPSLNLDQIS